MKAVQPYLFFNGNCRQAMELYAAALGSQLNLMTYGQQPNCPTGDVDRVLHAMIAAPDGSALMASDAPAADPMPEGKNFSVSIICDTREEQARIFAALSEGGHVLQPLQDTFWGAHFGMLEDRFGVKWMLSHQESQAAH